MKIGIAVRATIATGLCGAAILFYPKEQVSPQAVTERPREPETTQRICAPLPRGGWSDAELVLNNNSPDAVTVRRRSTVKEPPRAAPTSRCVRQRSDGCDSVNWPGY